MSVLSLCTNLEHKICAICKDVKLITEFGKNKHNADGLQYHCYDCDLIKQRKRRHEKYEQRKQSEISYRERKKDDFIFRMQGLLNASRQRAVAKNREHTLTREQLIDIFPKNGLCPVFGFKLEWNSAGFRETSPSIDRIDSSKGYTLDNVQIISWKANRIKNSATLEEIEAVFNYLKSGD